MVTGQRITEGRMKPSTRKDESFLLQLITDPLCSCALLFSSSLALAIGFGGGGGGGGSSGGVLFIFWPKDKTFT